MVITTHTPVLPRHTTNARYRHTPSHHHSSIVDEVEVRVKAVVVITAVATTGEHKRNSVYAINDDSDDEDAIKCKNTCKNKYYKKKRKRQN